MFHECDWRDTLCVPYGEAASFSNSMSMNCTGPFPSIQLSRETDHSLGISKGLRITRPCNPGSSDLFPLPPFALRPGFPISLVRRYPHDSYGGSVTLPFARFR